MAVVVVVVVVVVVLLLLLLVLVLVLVLLLLLLLLPAAQRLVPGACACCMLHAGNGKFLAQLAFGVAKKPATHVKSNTNAHGN